MTTSHSHHVEVSEFNPGPPPKSASVTFEPQGNGIKLTVEAIDAEGKPQSYHYAACFDGKDYPIIPGIGARTADTVALRRIDAYTRIHWWIELPLQSQR